MADFVTVYIDEAHATDDWVFSSNPYKIKTHVKLADRIVAAEILNEKKLPCPLVVDSMANRARKLYGAMPERLFIILNGTITYVGKQGPHGYNIEEIQTRLDTYRKTL